MLEVFDRWLIRRKINYIKEELAHAQNDAGRVALERELATELVTLETLDKPVQREDRAARH